MGCRCLCQPRKRAGCVALHYSAQPHAGRIIAEVAEEVAIKYDHVSIWVVHRVGSLRIGDSALMAAVASAQWAG
ncbi:molybdenum cofactor biosynthesis protein MoaE [Arthrobacter sp. ISL-69]|uniref:molybdenum cofactor biosynthesis protein MoaE n=1 Tax=Arthrobacter sp. ISL-69 TaxID=2819113 RepID=UPI001BE7B746|nr:molybdenum cofactor biosynthesis protein MoaE [Arthrobacter sp. ISL-69]MBT2538885.1 molybdenum cofactor biosynthesis protein MoaE [Arthrobacter sp. ISL-69]